ncbi:MAG: methyltransferase domain-containing protein [Planctomycetota bacterium]
MNYEPGFWDDCYAQNKTGWDRGGVHPAFHDWIDASAVRSGKVMVPGCGRGYEVVEFCRRDFLVTALDMADEPIRFLREQLSRLDLKAEVLQKDVLEFNAANQFDLVYEQTCLCAILPHQRTRYEQQVFRWLKPGGHYFVLFAQKNDDSAGPPFHCGLNEMKHLFSESRWKWSSKPMIRYDHPGGRLFEYATSLIRK